MDGWMYVPTHRGCIPCWRFVGDQGGFFATLQHLLCRLLRAMLLLLLLWIMICRESAVPRIINSVTHKLQKTESGYVPLTFIRLAFLSFRPTVELVPGDLFLFV